MIMIILRLSIIQQDTPVVQFMDDVKMPVLHPAHAARCYMLF